MRKFLLFILTVASSIVTATSLQNPASTQMLDRCFQRQSQVGIDDIFREISTLPSDYQTRELFLYVIDQQGVVMAHSRQPKMIGRNILPQLTAAAEPIFAQILNSDLPHQQLEFDYLAKLDQSIHISSRRQGKFIYIVQTRLK